MDTGGEASVLPRHFLYKINPNVKIGISSITIKNFSNQRIKTVGEIELKFLFK